MASNLNVALWLSGCMPRWTKGQLSVFTQRTGSNLRINLKNCQAGIVTAFTIVDPARFALLAILARSSSSGASSSPTIMRCMMLVDLCRPAGRDSKLLAELGPVIDTGDACIEPSMLHLRSICGDLRCSLVEGSPSSVITRIVLFGPPGADSVFPKAFSSRLSRRTSTLLLKYSSRQSSSLIPFPSGSGGTARFRSLSWTTL